MCQDFPSLPLAHVYNLLAFYLNQRDTVDAYLAEQAQTTTIIRQELRTTQCGRPIMTRISL